MELSQISLKSTGGARWVRARWGSAASPLGSTEKALDFRGGSGSSLIEPGDFQAHNGCHDVHRITRARHSRRGPRAKRPSAQPHRARCCRLSPAP